MKKFNIKWRVVGLFAMLIVALNGYAQNENIPSPDILSYIDKFKNVAQEEMLRAGIPASITLAQGIHESSFGKSVLATGANNHFGIKCHKEWTGPGCNLDDDAKDECFRMYNSPEESYRDHSDFLTSRPRYASLFTLDRTDYKSWAYGLKQAGYATNPKYPEILIKLIENYRLHAYDNIQNMLAQKNTEPKPIKQETTSTVEKVSTLEWQDKGSFNGIACITVENKTLPKTIAEKYNLSLKDLLAFNDMEEGDVFNAGERVYLAHKKKVGDTVFHTVKAGESMWQIAQQHGIQAHKLYEKNNMKMNDQPLAGETVYLQQKRKIAPRTMSYEAYLKEEKDIAKLNENNSTLAEEKNMLTASNDKIYNAITSKDYFPPLESFSADNSKESEIVYYEVQAKETLYGIARMFNINVQQLKEWNKLSDNNLKIGQQLIVKK